MMKFGAEIFCGPKGMMKFGAEIFCEPKGMMKFGAGDFLRAKRDDDRYPKYKYDKRACAV